MRKYLITRVKPTGFIVFLLSALASISSCKQPFGKANSGALSSADAKRAAEAAVDAEGKRAGAIATVFVVRPESGLQLTGRLFPSIRAGKSTKGSKVGQPGEIPQGKVRELDEFVPTEGKFKALLEHGEQAGIIRRIEQAEDVGTVGKGGQAAKAAEFELVPKTKLDDITAEEVAEAAKRGPVYASLPKNSELERLAPGANVYLRNGVRYIREGSDGNVYKLEVVELQKAEDITSALKSGEVPPPKFLEQELGAKEFAAYSGKSGEFLGVGSYGRVVSPEGSKDLAVKLIPISSRNDAAIDSIAEEIRILDAMSSHPNSMPFYGAKIVTVDGKEFVAVGLKKMDQTWKDARSTGVIPPADTPRFAAQMADALAALHSLGIEHLDLKPGNLFIGNGRAILGDFGLSSAGGKGKAGNLVPPEHAKLSNQETLPADALARQSYDVYALGVNWVELMLRGRGTGSRDFFLDPWRSPTAKSYGGTIMENNRFYFKDFEKPLKKLSKDDVLPAEYRASIKSNEGHIKQMTHAKVAKRPTAAQVRDRIIADNPGAFPVPAP